MVTPFTTMGISPGSRRTLNLSAFESMRSIVRGGDFLVYRSGGDAGDAVAVALEVTLLQLYLPSRVGAASRLLLAVLIELDRHSSDPFAMTSGNRSPPYEELLTSDSTGAGDLLAILQKWAG